jgi:hypothetical protein
MEPLTNGEHPSSNPLQEGCSGFPRASDTLKVVLKAAFFLKIALNAGYYVHWRNIDQ